MQEDSVWAENPPVGAARIPGVPAAGCGGERMRAAGGCAGNAEKSLCVCGVGDALRVGHTAGTPT